MYLYCEDSNVEDQKILCREFKHIFHSYCILTLKMYNYIMNKQCVMILKESAVPCASNFLKAQFQDQ